MSNRKIEIKLIYVLGMIVVIVLLAFIIHNVISQTENKSLAPQADVEASIGAKFKVQDVEFNQGDEVTINIELLEKSDFVAANFEYYYDNENLEYKKYEKGKSFENAAMLVVNDAGDKLKIAFVADPQKEKTLNAGSIVSLVFNQKNNVNVSEIKNSLKCSTLKNENGADVKYSIDQGYVKIK